ncbi:MAG: TAXI family TRAP transporter solute-binding subunit [Alphaproteobacteria bacterium]
MKSIASTAAVVAAVVSLTGAASAQIQGIATTKGGATAQVSTAIAKVVSLKSPLQLRTQVMGGTQQYIPVVNAGEIAFGLSNLPQYTMAKTGTGLSAGTKHDNLRIVATMMVFRVGPIVGRNSGINKLSDLRGKRAPAGFKAAPLFNYVLGSMLANAGLSIDDTQKVPVIALRQHWNAFKQGKIDVMVGAVGTGVLKEINAAVKGGIKYLTLDPSDEAVKRTVAVYPGSYLKVVKPAKPFTGVLEPVHVLHFDYLFWTHKDAPNDLVYTVTKTMYENEKLLRESSPLWRSHSSKRMSKDQGFALHPAALKFYKEVGAR